MAEDEKKKGCTDNDSGVFYGIACVNLFVLAVVLMLASGGGGGSGSKVAGVKEQNIFSQFFGARDKWNAGERPLKDSSLKFESKKEKEKVLTALQRVAGDTAGDKPDAKRAEDPLLNLMNEIDTKAELDEFKQQLNDDELFDRMKNYLKASRAEMTDYFPLAFMAACAGAALFGAFIQFAQSSADEVTEDSASPASPSKSPAKSPSRLLQRLGGMSPAEDFSGMDANNDGRVTRSEARSARSPRK